MEATQIRTWLLAQPKPASVRLSCADDQTHEMEVVPGGSWARLAESIAAMEPVRIDALDAKGKLIRAVKPAEHQEHEDDDELEQGVAPAAKGNPLAGDDAETRRFRLVAELIAQAYRHSTDVAFNKMTDMFGAMNHRADALAASLETTNKMLRKAYDDQLQAQIDAANSEIALENKKDGLDEIIGAVVTSAVQGQADRAAAAATTAAKTAVNGKQTNGKAKG